jgi:dTDP-4-dehydrorhamnose 3,5-epimerase-like enzyme
MDDRGYLIEIARVMDSAGPHSVVHQFGQVYLVGDMRAGTVRAFHKHAELWDWFFINHGSAKFVLSDDRPDSPTKASWP